MNLRLRIPEDEIASTAARYLCPPEEDSLLARRGKIQVQGRLTMEDLRDAARWKSPRIMRVIDRNDEQYVEEITRFAFAASCERARIQSLTVLDGVGWPMASVLLHLFHADRYPILDFRALWQYSTESQSD